MNVGYRLVLLDHPELEPERERYESFPSYVRVPANFAHGMFDLIVVDGHYRTTCIRPSVPRVAPGGLLLVDDVDMWGGIERVPLPKNWEGARKRQRIQAHRHLAEAPAVAVAPPQ